MRARLWVRVWNEMFHVRPRTTIASFCLISLFASAVICSFVLHGIGGTSATFIRLGVFVSVGIVDLLIIAWALLVRRRWSQYAGLAFCERCACERPVIRSSSPRIPSTVAGKCAYCGAECYADDADVKRPIPNPAQGEY